MNNHDLDKNDIAQTEENDIFPDKVPEAQNETERQVTELQGRISELENELARARADFFNYRQRAEKEKARIRTSISEDRVLDFIPVLDNLDRALNVPEDSSASDVLKGVRMVQRQFLSVLQDLGVEVITVGLISEFDTLLHDAVGTEEVMNPNYDGKIMQELLKGYRTKERVLRPSQVRVGKLASTN
jgi:molecular chaperone GrpE (heat shock protein)